MTNSLPEISWVNFDKRNSLILEQPELNKLMKSGECRIIKTINKTKTVVILDREFIDYYLAYHLSAFLPTYGASRSHYELLNNWIDKMK